MPQAPKPNGHRPAVGRLKPAADETRPRPDAGLRPVGYISPAELIGQRLIYDHRTWRPGFETNYRLGTAPEQPAPAPKVVELIDRLELTPTSRQWLLASRPRIVDIPQTGCRLALPTDRATRSYSHWQRWWQTDRPTLPDQLDWSLRSHFVHGLTGAHWPNNGRIEAYSTPIYPMAGPDHTIFHELLHVAHATMPPYRQRLLYGDLLELLQLPTEALEQNCGLDKDALISGLANAGQRWQTNLVPGSDPALADRFLAGIRRSRPGQFWLPGQTLHVRAIVALLDEAYAQVGSDATGNLGPALEAHYRPYCQNRAKTANSLQPAGNWPARSQRIRQYLAGLDQLAGDESLTQPPTDWWVGQSNDHPDRFQPPYLARCLELSDWIEADLDSLDQNSDELEKRQLKYCLAKARFLFCERLSFELRQPW